MTDQDTGHRHARLERILLEEIRSLLRDDVEDPSLFGVHVTALTLSVDYRHARVHYALKADAAGERRAVDRSLTRATPFLRARLAEVVEMKRTPDLRFVFDAAVFLGDDEGKPS